MYVMIFLNISAIVAWVKMDKVTWYTRPVTAATFQVATEIEPSKFSLGLRSAVTPSKSQVMNSWYRTFTWRGLRGVLGVRCSLSLALKKTQNKTYQKKDVAARNSIEKAARQSETGST